MTRVLFTSITFLMFLISTAHAGPITYIRAGLAARQVNKINRQVQALAEKSKIYNYGAPLAVSSETSTTSISNGKLNKLVKNFTRLHGHVRAVVSASPRSAGEMKALLEQVQPPSLFGQLSIHKTNKGIRFSGHSNLETVAKFAQSYSDLYLLGKTIDAKMKPFVFLAPDGNGISANITHRHQDNGVEIKTYVPSY